MDKLSIILGALIATAYFALGYYVHYKWGPKKANTSQIEKKPNKTLESITDDRGFLSYKKYKG